MIVVPDRDAMKAVHSLHSELTFPSNNPVWAGYVRLRITIRMPRTPATLGLDVPDVPVLACSPASLRSWRLAALRILRYKKN